MSCALCKICNKYHVTLKVFVYHIETVKHTDWISGFGPFSGGRVGAKPKAILSTDTEKVLLAFIQIWNHQRLSSTGCVYLEEQDEPQICVSKAVC